MKLGKRRILQLAIVGLGLPLLFAFQNCANQQLSFDTVEDASNNGNGGNGGANLTDGNGVIAAAPATPPQNCSTVLQQSTFPAKLIFIVDVSGSNTGGNGTDPNKTYRAGSINDFFLNHKTKMNFHWAFSTFAGTSASALIGTGTNPQLGDDLAMETAIATFMTVPDNGNTPYQQAIEQARQTIVNDPNNSMDSKYIVVFLSDGQPNPTRSDAQLKGYVQNLLAAAPGQVTFNTIYYGNLNNAAGNRMYMMALEGGGQFLDVNLNPQGKSFPISNVVTIAGVVCPPSQ